MSIKTDADRLADAAEIIRKRNAEIADQKRYIDRLQRDNDTAEEIRKVIFEIAERSPEPPEWINKDFGSSGVRGAPCTIWSDWHWGEVINSDEVGGVNKYNEKIARNRAVDLVNKTVDLCFNHMGRSKQKYPGIIVMLGGDMIGGDIHEELMATNDRTPMQSINDLTDVLAAGIDNLATKFGRVFLPCVVGNHGRSSRKPRMKGRVITNYDWSIYCNLERYFRKEKNIQFLIPSTTDAFFKVYGHRYLLTHGDSLGVKGGDGIIGAIGPIMRGAMKVGRNQAQLGRDIDTLCICHWHQYIALPGVVVNNAFKGFDEYAMIQLRARYSIPTQALWLTHPDFGITFHLQVFLDKLRKADDSKEWVTWQH